jgi:HB1, ASXL, restriction endonuclease HTH domain
MKISWVEAIIKVLTEEKRPMHYSEISELILSRGYYETAGATPDNTVSSQITTSIRKDGLHSPFIRVSRGTYALKDEFGPTKAEDETPGMPDVPAVIDAGTGEAEVAELNNDDEQDASVIQALGMYWQRDLVIWRANPKIYGKQQANSEPIDFCEQRGVYILYDHHTVVYAGRSVDRPLGQRLFEHTKDRIGGRWNRFSWFGLRRVTDDGGLVEPEVSPNFQALINSFEALLIEALEPPLNRKRGDNFNSMEYIQDIDPELKEQDIQSMLRSFEQALRGNG